jgi:two-component system, NtrC family, nitrogen regulation sensor histidine kinase NtrY
MLGCMLGIQLISAALLALVGAAAVFLGLASALPSAVVALSTALLLFGAGLLLAPGRPLLSAFRASQRVPRVAGQEPLLNGLLSAFSDAVLCFSDDGTIRYANQAALRLFFEGQDSSGRNFLELIQNAKAPLRDALLGDSDRFFSIELSGWSESYHLSRCSFELDGEVHTTLVVKHMTRQLGTRETEVLRRLVQVLSHEVNNSLGPIISLASSARVLLQRSSVERLEEALATIQERAGHLAGFISAYAAVARLPQPKPRSETLEAIISRLRNLFPEVYTGSTPEGQAWFDSGQVEQVLVNLIKNALEAGSRPQDIGVRAEVLPGGASLWEVTDRGEGLSEEGRRSAFLPLYTTKQNGSGLGLAVCREIAEAHGGSIGIEARPGGGARVAMMLPGRPGRDSNLSTSRLTLTYR